MTLLLLFCFIANRSYFRAGFLIVLEMIFLVSIQYCHRFELLIPAIVFLILLNLIVHPILFSEWKWFKSFSLGLMLFPELLMLDVFYLREYISDRLFDQEIVHVKIDKKERWTSTGKIRATMGWDRYSYTIHGLKVVDTTNEAVSGEGDSGYIKRYIGGGSQMIASLDDTIISKVGKEVGELGFFCKGKLYNEHDYTLEHPQYMLDHWGITIAYQNSCGWIVYYDIRHKTGNASDSTYDEEVSHRAVEAKLLQSGYCYVYDGKFYSSDEMELQCPVFKTFMEDYLKSNTPSWYTEFLESGRTEE